MVDEGGVVEFELESEEASGCLPLLLLLLPAVELAELVLLGLKLVFILDMSMLGIVSILLYLKRKINNNKFFDFQKNTNRDIINLGNNK